MSMYYVDKNISSIKIVNVILDQPSTILLLHWSLNKHFTLSFFFQRCERVALYAV